MLEENVDDKYYLSNKAIGRLVRHSNRIIRKQENPNISSCLMANYFAMGGRNQQYIKDDKATRICGIYDEQNKRHQAGSIYDKNGVSPTITTSTGGHVQPYILVNEGTKKGYTKAFEGDSLNVSYPQNINKRGRVGKQVSQTILASNMNMATLEKTDKPICINNEKEQPSLQDRIYDTKGISTTITTGNFRPNIAEATKMPMFNPYNKSEIKEIAPTQTRNCGNINSSAAVLITEDGKYCFRIRKLTPKECWRLMRIFR